MPFTAFLGEDEIAQNKVSVKNMADGTQETLSPEDAIARIQAAIAVSATAAPIREPAN